jgi:hypothetical protein
LEKDYVNYIMNGNPGLPDEELLTPDEQVADIGERLMPESIKEKAPDKWIRARELYELGWSDRKIALEIGVSDNGVLQWRKRENLPSQRDRGIKATRTNEGPSSFKRKAPPCTDPVTTERPEIIEQQELVAEMKADIYEAKETCRKLQENIPDSQVTSLAAITLKILLQIWRRLGKEESA